jgi:hypothetical protein
LLPQLHVIVRFRNYFPPTLFRIANKCVVLYDPTNSNLGTVPLDIEGHLPTVTAQPLQPLTSRPPTIEDVRKTYLARFGQMPVAEQEAHLLIAFQWLTRNVTRQSDQQRE